MKKIITITGDLGSGKSTVSKILIEKLNYDYIYTGKIQREIADRYRMTTLELNQYAETHPEIDEEIDSTFKTLNESTNLIVDSRMAWFFIPDSFKVYLKTDVVVAAARILNDNQRKSEKKCETLEEAVQSIEARKTSENQRYMDLYGADSSNMLNFNLIIDTTRATPEETADKIIIEFQNVINQLLS